MNKGPEVRTANGPSLLLVGRVCGCLCNGWRVNGRQEAREEAIAVIKGRMMAF